MPDDGDDGEEATISAPGSCFQAFFMLITIQPPFCALSWSSCVQVPAFAPEKPARGKCREHLRAPQGAEALPDVGPLHIAAEQLREMTGGQVDMRYGDGHGRKRLSVNFVGCRGFRSTST